MNTSQSLFTVSGSLLSIDLVTRGFLMALMFPSSVRSASETN